MRLGMTIRAILAISAGLISATAGAQLLPGSLPLPNVGETVDRVGRGLQDGLDRTSERLERRADALADMAAAAPGGGLAAVRGTSYAVPLVAGRLYRHSDSENALASLDAEAAERDRRGFGRGLVCGTCRTPLPRR